MAINIGPTVVNTVDKSDSDFEVVEKYDIVADRSKMNEELVGSDEVDAITSTLEVANLETIVSFGNEVAENISRASDVVLRSMDMSQLDNTSVMLTTLSKIMDKFDVDEIKDDGDKGIINKLFGNAKKQLEKILAKYHTMGDEVDKVYVELKKYEAEIKESNRKLEDMFKANVEYYHELVKYILAGEQGCRELSEYLSQRRNDMQESGDNSIQFEITSLEQAQQLLEQRVQDLRTAESVALQSVPMIKTMAFSNMNLVRKINSAFIITLPVFKEALAQAIMLKRQKIQADAISALDKRTNEMLVKNAKNSVEQSKMITKMASGSSIKIETLETSWRTIVDGIEATRQIQEDASRKREEDRVRLQAIKDEFNLKYSMPKV